MNDPGFTLEHIYELICWVGGGWGMDGKSTNVDPVFVALIKSHSCHFSTVASNLPAFN